MYLPLSAMNRSQTVPGSSTVTYAAGSGDDDESDATERYPIASFGYPRRYPSLVS